jgi:DNA-binding LacI/PurR family transcriptional regulator
MEPDMTPDNSDSLYFRVKQQLLDLLMAIPLNDRIPTRNELTKLFGVARTTIDRAISELIGEGYLYSRIGSGTYVVSHSKKKEANSFSRSMWGILLPSINSYKFPEMIRGAEDVCSEEGISLILCNTDNDVNKQDRYIDQLLSSGVSAMIVVPTVDKKAEAQERFRSLVDKGIKIVFCTRGVQGISNVPKIMGNDYHGARSATSYLFERGWKRPAFVSKRFFQTVEQRYCGYLSALYDNNMSFDENYICLEASDQYIYDKIAQWKDMTDPPDSIFCFNDEVAIVVCQAIRNAGLKVGKDIGVISYDDTNVCEELSPKLTSVSTPNYEIGRMASRTLLQMIGGEPIPNNQLIILEPELVIRESC